MKRQANILLDKTYGEGRRIRGKVWGAGAGKALENLAEMNLSTGDSDSAAECPLNLGHEH